MKNIFKYMAGVLIASFARQTEQQKSLRVQMEISRKLQIMLTILK